MRKCVVDEVAVLFQVVTRTSMQSREMTKAYLLVSGPMKGLVISWTVALEANSIPTLTFSLSSVEEERGQSELFCCGAAVVVGMI